MNIEYESENDIQVNFQLDYDVDLALAISESLKNKILHPKEVHSLILQKLEEFLQE